MTKCDCRLEMTFFSLALSKLSLNFLSPPWPASCPTSADGVVFPPPIADCECRPPPPPPPPSGSSGNLLLQNGQTIRSQWWIRCVAVQFAHPPPHHFHLHPGLWKWPAGRTGRQRSQCLRRRSQVSAILVVFAAAALAVGCRHLPRAGKAQSEKENLGIEFQKKFGALSVHL
jgi:hypothetical protein